MPKMKTNKAIAKRVKITARGKFKRHRAGAGHLKSAKTPKQLRGLRQSRLVPKNFERHVRRLLGV